MLRYDVRRTEYYDSKKERQRPSKSFFFLPGGMGYQKESVSIPSLPPVVRRPDVTRSTNNNCRSSESNEFDGSKRNGVATRFAIFVPCELDFIGDAALQTRYATCSTGVSSQPVIYPTWDAWSRDELEPRHDCRLRLRSQQPE